MAESTMRTRAALAVIPVGAMAVIAAVAPSGSAGRAIFAWAAAATVGWAVRLPTPTGVVMTLGPGVLLAASPILDGIVALSLVWGLAACAWWLVDRVGRITRSGGAPGVAAGASMVLVFVAVDGTFDVRGVEGGWPTVVSLVAAGIAWFLTRNLLLAAGGREDVETSARFAWLATLEDWRSVVTVLAPGALFGLAYPDLGWWALAVVGLLLGFGQLTAYRHCSIARTYDQTIEALSQVPEVGDLIVPGHAARTADLAGAVARRWGLEPPLVRRIEHAALLHDVGAIAAQAVGGAQVCNQDLAAWGAQIVGAVPTLVPVARVIDDHGRPYRDPSGRTTSLVSGASIVRVTAAYEQRVSAGVAPLDALQELFLGAAYQYDPDVVNELRLLLIDRSALPD